MIHVVTGRPGEGKTWFVTSLVPKFLMEGNRVGLNFDIDFESCPELEPFKNQVDKVTTFSEILGFTEGILVLDEAQVWFNNREWKEIPLDLQNKWQQHRKDRIDIFICAQDQSRIEITIRQLIGRYFSCEKILNRIFVIREYEPKINAETQQIEEQPTKRWWIQIARIKLDDPRIKFKFWEILKLGWKYPHRIYDNKKRVAYAKDAKHDGSKSVSDLERKHMRK